MAKAKRGFHLLWARDSYAGGASPTARTKITIPHSKIFNCGCSYKQGLGTRGARTYPATSSTTDGGTYSTAQMAPRPSAIPVHRQQLRVCCCAFALKRFSLGLGVSWPARLDCAFERMHTWLSWSRIQMLTNENRLRCTPRSVCTGAAQGLHATHQFF